MFSINMCRLNEFRDPVLDSFLGIHGKIVTNYNDFYSLLSQSASKDNFLGWLCKKYKIELLNRIWVAPCSFKITQWQYLNLKRICLLRNKASAPNLISSKKYHF